MPLSCHLGPLGHIGSRMNENVRNKGHFLGLTSFQWSLLAGLLFIFVFVWDIGNILAPRQGTESLYVQISKEMYELGSYLTPMYRGEAHWSKPPLQFWLPMPLYALFGGFSLTLARLSMAFTSIASVGLIFWLLKRQKISLSLVKVGIIFLSSFGILKFSRIFMMEVPLSLLPLLGALAFYDYLQTRSRFMWGLSILFIGLGGLVKGPVSLAMGYTSLASFWFYQFKWQRKNIFNDVMLTIVCSLGVCSIWYLLCFQKHGMEFINYFFLRENLGKFGQSSSMSPLKIIQGLIIYTFPWLHLIRLKQIKQQLTNPFFVYLVIHFLIFFLIWFIPSQKSHHYAMPGFAFWLVILLISPRSFSRDHLSRMLFWLQVVILILLSFIFLYFSNSVVELAIALIPVMLLLFSIHHHVSSYGIGISFVILFTMIASRFYLPLIPNAGVEALLTQKHVSVFFNDRRPFFLEERLGRKVKLFVKDAIASGDYIVTPENRAKRLETSRLESLFSWEKWKRKIVLQDVANALKQRDLKYLKSSYILYKVK